MLQRRLTSLAFALAWMTNLYGQGLLLDDTAYNSIIRIEFEEGSKGEQATLRNIAKVSLRNFCPTPQHQGNISSCTGWACGYGAMTILYAMRQKLENNQQEINQNAFSALFIYNQIKNGGCDGGASIDKASKFLMNNGNIRFKEFDKLKNNCNKQPTESELLKAKLYKIQSYNSLFASNEDPDKKIENVKLSLLNNNPIIIGMLLKKNFEKLNAKNTTWYPEIGDTTFYGAHCMVAIGFDEDKQAFEVMNSWGANWADGGFGWIKYKDFGKYCSYGVQLNANGKKNEQPLESKISLQQLKYDEKLNIHFEKLNPVLDNNQYVVPNTLNKESLLQVVCDNVSETNYGYLISYNSKSGQATLHWPKLIETKEGAYIRPQQILPSKDNALIFEQYGTEYICFILSKKAIHDISNKITELSQNQPIDFVSKFYKTFKKQIASVDGCSYSRNELQCKAKTPKVNGIAFLIKLNIT